MEKPEILREGDTFIIGESPRLIVNIKGSPNYIVTDTQRIPFRKEICLSPDLIRGERENVLKTALTFYYDQACSIVRGYQMAAACRKRANP